MDQQEVASDVLASGRAACYKARDLFYTCVEKQKNLTPTESASVGLLYPTACKKARAEFEKNCRLTWVKHFDRQYCATKRVNRLLDKENKRGGPITLPEPSTFKQ